MVSSPLTVKNSIGCALCTDYSNLKNYKSYGFETQEFPKNLLQKEEETLAQWRDRLYHQFRMPTILSSLSDLKLSYVELINPLLSKKILKQVRELPDYLRTEKTLFKKIVLSLSPKIDFATKDATATPKNILVQKDITELIKKELSTKEAKAIFPTDFLEYISKGIKTQQQTKTSKSSLSSLKDFVKKIMPQYLKNAIKDKAPLASLNHNTLAFRVYIICRMHAIIKDDLENATTK